MLSASKDLLRLVSYRVSLSQKEFVILLPVLKYLGASERAHLPYVLSKLPEEEEKKQKEILKWHPKINSRKLNVKEKQKKVGSNVMEFRILLKFKEDLNFASVANDDPFLW